MKNEINLTIEPREKDIGIKVRRILPWAKKRMVGPFIFLDEMGPAHLHPPADHVDVRPHPHIGLSTLTYLFEGALVHRDSLGVVKTIVPGEVNWMTAGKGISHSEREEVDIRFKERTLHGLQFWVALPKDKEDMDATFFHYSEKEIPKIESTSSSIHVVAGELQNKKSPLIAHSPMCFFTIHAKGTGEIEIPNTKNFELAFYVVKGQVTMNDKTYHAQEMVVLKEGSSLSFSHSEDALVGIIGGEAFPEERHIWWNLVSSSQEKIEAAKKAWADNSFPQVPGETEKIPLPND